MISALAVPCYGEGRQNITVAKKIAKHSLYTLAKY